MVSSAAFPPTSAAFALLALSAVLPGKANCTMSLCDYNITLLYVATSSGSSTLVPGFSECIFNDHRYRIGETFHPTVRVNGQEREYICHLCTCQPVSRPKSRAAHLCACAYCKAYAHCVQLRAQLKLLFSSPENLPFCLRILSWKLGYIYFCSRLYG